MKRANHKNTITDIQDLIALADNPNAEKALNFATRILLAYVPIDESCEAINEVVDTLQDIEAGIDVLRLLEADEGQD